MSDSTQCVPTVGEIARRLGVPLHRVEYIIRARKIRSASWAGNCRIFTEGLFGIRPTGLGAFECVPRLPTGWDHAALSRIHAFGRVWNLSVERAPDGLRVTVTDAAGGSLYDVTAAEGTTHRIDFARN